MNNEDAGRFGKALLAMGGNRGPVLVFADLLGAYVAYEIALLWVVYGPSGSEPLQIPDHYPVALILCLFLQPFIFDTFGLYRAWRGDSPLREIMRLLSAWALLMVVLVILSAVSKTTAIYSRVWFVSWASVGVIWFIGVHGAIWWAAGAARRAGYNHKRILLVGDELSASRVVRVLSQHPEAGFEPAIYCADAPSDDPVLRLLPYGGPLARADAAVLKSVDQIWLAFSSAEHQGLRAALNQLQHAMIPIRLVPNLLSVRLLSAPVGYAAGMTLFDLNAVPVQGMTRLIKELVDRLGALLALLLLLPLWVVIAIGIKSSSAGPVFFRQYREGRNGEIFSIYKFRTMHALPLSDAGLRQARRSDPRIFPFGEFLRRYSLDELPQLLNVLRGDMSLVGPRPHAVEHSEQYRPLVEFYGWRQMVKPGITGWAQIHGLRGETIVPDKMRQRVEYDLYYVRNWSLWLDFEILLVTVVKGFSHPNAY